MKHFYHLCAAPGSDWELIAREHLAMLEAHPARWDLTVGIIGSGTAADQARTLFPGAQFLHAAAGYEQLTLRALHQWAAKVPPSTPVLYAHSKGVTHRDDAETILEHSWRASMTRHLVSGWEQCVQLIADGCDLVGCHWLTPEQYPVIETPIFGGNFWWARAGYAAALPPVQDTTRYHAEGWIGQAGPRICDLNPGWPRLGVNL